MNTEQKIGWVGLFKKENYNINIMRNKLKQRVLSKR